MLPNALIQSYKDCKKNCLKTWIRFSTNLKSNKGASFKTLQMLLLSFVFPKTQVERYFYRKMKVLWRTCKWANSWLMVWGMWSFSRKKLRASEHCLNWSDVRESRGGKSGENSEEEEEAAAAVAMADLLRWFWWPRLEKRFPSSVFSC